MEQLSALYTDPESHNAQRHRRTDGRTDGQQAYANSRSYCVAVRLAKKLFNVSLFLRSTTMLGLGLRLALGLGPVTLGTSDPLEW